MNLERRILRVIKQARDRPSGSIRTVMLSSLPWWNHRPTGIQPIFGPTGCPAYLVNDPQVANQPSEAAEQQQIALPVHLCTLKGLRRRTMPVVIPKWDYVRIAHNTSGPLRADPAIPSRICNYVAQCFT